MAKSRERVNAFADRKAPRPKGPNPGKIPRSTPYVDPRSPETRRATATVRGRDSGDDLESQAFTPRELPVSNRSRAVSAAALASSRARMTGNFEDAQPDHDSRSLDEAFDDELGERELGNQIETADAGFSREDVEAIVNEALKRDRAARQPAPVESRGEILPQRATFVPDVTKARVAEHAHPADAFQPPQQPRGKIDSGDVALPHGALSHPSGLLAMPLRVADVDRLWDWLRADGDQGRAFLGVPITTSPSLHDHLSFLAKDAEQQGVALIRALYWKGTHFGFAMLAPILADEATALMHIYLMKEARGSLQAILPALVALAQQAAPGKHLAVASPDKVWAKLHRTLLAPLGFVEHTMFVL